METEAASALFLAAQDERDTYRASVPPVLYTLPQDLYPASVATYRELTLFLSLYADLWQYWAFVKDCGLDGPVYGDVLLTSSIVRLRELIGALPGPYELRPTANPLHYPTRYAEYS